MSYRGKETTRIKINAEKATFTISVIHTVISADKRAATNTYVVRHVVYRYLRSNKIL